MDEINQSINQWIPVDDMLSKVDQQIGPIAPTLGRGNVPFVVHDSSSSRGHRFRHKALQVVNIFNISSELYKGLYSYEDIISSR